MSEKFKKGDIVRLKSGGPKMTIDGVDQISKTVHATWFAGSKHQRAHFSFESIEIVPPDEAKK